MNKIISLAMQSKKNHIRTQARTQVEDWSWDAR